MFHLGAIKRSPGVSSFVVLVPPLKADFVRMMYESLRCSGGSSIAPRYRLLKEPILQHTQSLFPSTMSSLFPRLPDVPPFRRSRPQVVYQFLIRGALQRKHLWIGALSAPRDVPSVRFRRGAQLLSAYCQVKRARDGENRCLI
jgi:hypothetical protein